MPIILWTNISTKFSTVQFCDEFQGHVLKYSHLHLVWMSTNKICCRRAAAIIAPDSFKPASYLVGSKSFRPDIQKPLQMENAVRDI